MSARKLLRFSIVVAVPKDLEPEVVKNDIADYVGGAFNFVEDSENLPGYDMSVHEIEFEGEE